MIKLNYDERGKKTKEKLLDLFPKRLKRFTRKVYTSAGCEISKDCFSTVHAVNKAGAECTPSVLSIDRQKNNLQQKETTVLYFTEYSYQEQARDSKKMCTVNFLITPVKICVSGELNFS